MYIYIYFLILPLLKKFVSTPVSKQGSSKVLPLSNAAVQTSGAKAAACGQLASLAASSSKGNTCAVVLL